MVDEKIFWGFDIGTDSVGWAVTNSEYKLKKYKNNLMWGVHLFDEAKQSAERRSFRTARRRLDRRKQRIILLQEFFVRAVCEKDENFFRRLKESALLPEDAEHRTNNIFFDDPDYTDKDYFEEYPTIHHLICELMESKEPHDVRLVYLACVYLLAHRGHFLLPVSEDDISKVTEFEPLYESFYKALEEKLDEEPPFDRSADDFAEILKSHKTVSAKNKDFDKLLFGGKVKTYDNKNISYSALIKLLSGGTEKLSKFFANEEYTDLEKDSVCVRNADFGDTLEMLEGQIDELDFALLKSVKSLYDWSLLVDILEGKSLISEAKKDKYDEHRYDLDALKYLFREYLTKDDYNEMFKEVSGKQNYASYVYNAPSDKTRDSKYKKCNQEDFCKFTKKFLSKIKPNEKDKPCLDKLLEKCEQNSLCPKQVTTDNRVIPYQLYYVELKKILKNACGYLPFLNERDEYGTVADKILNIMKFRVPYYVGPLVDSKKSPNAWLVRKLDGKITPWNFTDMVNEDDSEKAFIRRMTCKCTYVAGQDVLPKYSLLYSKFSVLNEINNIKLNGEPISVQAKQEIYTELFERNKSRVSKKKIRDCLISHGYAADSDEVTGIDDIAKSALRSYHDFKKMLSNGILTEQQVEEIIEHITVTTDNIRLKKWLKTQFPMLADEDVKYITKLKYKDYGRLSRCFLEDVLPVDTKTGEAESDKNIITMLWETNENIMQLLSSKYRYSENIEHMNRQYYALPENHKSMSERLKDMYVATAVRRAVTRTFDIVKELKKIQGRDPDKIFIEMARGTGETPKGKRTNSRKDQILEHWRGLDNKDINDLKKSGIWEHLDTIDDTKLRSDKYFLYFMQLGRCMYTEKPIPFEEVENEHKWNIDHIWPQAKIKDDSLDNKVLVSSNENGKKSDSYPISDDIRHSMAGLWHSLYKKGIISEKKYQRLTRSTPFTDDELSGFIARQLVETRQSTKAVATLLKEQFPNTEIVYVKAGLVSDFRQEMGMLKCREVNDLHHANDAYLNIVLGNVYNTRFTKDPLNFVKNNEKYSIKIFQKNSDGKKTGVMTRKVERGGEVAWDPETSFAIVRKMMSKNSIRYVRYAYMRKSGQNGGFFDQNPLRKGKGMVSIKHNLSIEKYGGYDNATISFFSLVSIKDFGVILLAVELLSANKFLKNISEAKEYAADKLSKELNVKIVPNDVTFPLNNRYNVVKINSVLELDGYRVMIAAKQNSSIKFVSNESLILSSQHMAYVKKITKFIEKRKQDKVCMINEFSGISSEDNIELYDVLVSKCNIKPFNIMYENLGIKLSDNRDNFIKKSVENQVLILSEMVRLFKTGRKTGVNLEEVGGRKNSGVKTLNTCLYKVKDYSNIFLVDQSPTGLIERKSPNLLDL